MIFSFVESSNILIKYDLKTCKAYVGTAFDCDVARYFTPQFDQLCGGCQFNEILYKERILTKFGSQGALKAIKKMHDKAKKFGRCSGIEGGMLDGELDKIELCKEKITLLKNIISVFENKGTTDWAFDGVGRGVLRVYPSNGAIHSFRPKITMGKYVFNYFPFSRDLSVDVVEEDGLGDYLYIICELDRVLEKYSDMAAIVALYIELGHVISVLHLFLEVDIYSLTLTSFEEGDDQDIIFARLAI